MKNKIKWLLNIHWLVFALTFAAFALVHGFIITLAWSTDSFRPNPQWGIAFMIGVTIVFPYIFAKSQQIEKEREKQFEEYLAHHYKVKFDREKSDYERKRMKEKLERSEGEMGSEHFTRKESYGTD